ncbi:MAG: BrnT family toxin [Roseibium sp.]
MEIEWDENKRQKTLLERGIDILDAALIFENDVLSRVDDREDYGELRFISLGMTDDECYVVVHTERDGKLRIITAWKGGRSDREKYKNSFPD